MSAATGPSGNIYYSGHSSSQHRPNITLCAHPVKDVVNTGPQNGYAHSKLDMFKHTHISETRAMSGGGHDVPKLYLVYLHANHIERTHQDLQGLQGMSTTVYSFTPLSSIWLSFFFGGGGGGDCIKA